MPKTRALQEHRVRCWWCGEDQLYQSYHDDEWGVPVHDDRKLFEMLLLESFQAGLSWLTILRKREHFRRAFADFDPVRIARFSDADVKRLREDSTIVRNEAKIVATINNARHFCDLQESFGSFDTYVWEFTDGRTLLVPGRTRETIPTYSPEAEALSKDLKARGFAFVGPTVCYAHMQATGMVDDHVTDCWKYRGARTTAGRKR